MIGEFIIEHATAKGLMLGLTGWVAQRPAALSFDDEASAGAWLADWRVSMPKLLGTEQHRIVRKPAPIEATGGSVQSDWDPYGWRV